MRPRRLRIKGGTAFVQEADLDFEGLDLFAITGPTGAGKTSLLDAMTIALYGRSPRLGDDLRQVISPLAKRAQFFLEFRARGRDYRVTRVLFRNRPTTVALEQRSDDGAWQTLARGVREATAQVEQILGLDFDSFTKVVLLPQNEFDAFLRGKPEERRSILIRLLSLEVYGRIQQRANQVAADARTQADLLTGLLDGDYADATPERLGEIRDARAAAEAALAAASARIAALERAAEAALELRARRQDHRTAAASLAGHVRTLGEARDEHAAAARALDAARRAVERSSEELAAVPYDADRHLLLTRAEERATRLGEVIAALTSLDAEDTASQLRLAELTRRRDEAARAASDAERKLQSAGDAATRSRAELEARQHRFGTRPAIATLSERERRYREDRAQEKTLQQALDDLTAREARLAHEHEALGRRHADASTRLADARRRLEKRERELEAARALQNRATTLAQSLAHATARVARAASALAQARGVAGERRSALEEAAETRQAAEDVARAAEERLRDLERAHAVHALRAGLAPGQPCPVCEIRVERVPATEPLGPLENARQACADQRGRLAEAQQSERRAALDLAAAEEAERAAGTAWEEARGEEDRLARELGDVLPPELHGDRQWPERLQSRTDAAAAARASAEHDVREAQTRVTELDTTIARIGTELGMLPARRQQQDDALHAIRARCAETERLLAALLDGPPGPDAATRLQAIDTSLREAEEAMAAAAAEVERTREQVRQAQQAARDAEHDVATETTRSESRAHARGGFIRERDEIRRALDAIAPGHSDVASAVRDELAALVAARQRRDELGRRLDEARQSEDLAERQVARATARVAELERQSDAHRQHEASARRALESALAELGKRLSAADVTLPRDADQHAAERGVDPDDKGADIVLPRGADQHAALRGVDRGDKGVEVTLPPGADEHDALARIVQQARQDHDAAVRRAAALGAEEQALADRIRRAAECREQRDAARARADVARELGQLLGAANLQTYVLADAMHVLVEDGSEHLRRLSDGRYRLRAQDLDFHVVDAWNGDAARSVKTLSGGETFLTSLALALALAERLADLAAGAHGHEALESLFIDEGFGALDGEETLETVVQAIEALQTQDRLVGIVTHLTPLAERMPAQIKVRKAPEGSRLEVVR